MMRHLLVGLLAALALATTAVSAPAQTGTAVGVDPQAAAESNDGSRTLVVGADVSVGELVRTGQSGQVQLLFADATKLVVGPNSSLLIEQYLLRGTSSVSQMTVNALAGSFRFITGSSPKEAYRIATPTGTIGVRGTEFDFTVTSRETKVLVYEGVVQICNLAGQCVTLGDVCEVGEYNNNESVSLGNDAAEGGDFRYLRSQGNLLQPFLVANREQCLPPQRQVVAVPESLNTTAGVGDPDCDYSEYPGTYPGEGSEGGGSDPCGYSNRKP